VTAFPAARAAQKKVCHAARAESLNYSGATLSIDMERIVEAERLGEWMSCGVTTMMVTDDQRAVRLMAELAL